jgi:acyl carrier protein
MVLLPSTTTVLRSEPLHDERRVQDELRAIWRQALEREDIGPGDDFFDLGGDSMAAVQILAAIHKAFGCQLAATALLEARTIERLAVDLCRRPEPPPWSPLVELQATGPHPPFFCVHGVGGEVLSFCDLARQLAPDQPFFGLRALGSDSHAPPLRRIEEMASYYLEAIGTVQSRPPYYLGGFSFGGSVALEMARQLQAQGRPVALLAILDHTPRRCATTGCAGPQRCRSRLPSMRAAG